MNYSKVKNSIYQVICDNPYHLTAEQIIEKVQETENKASVATVYRNLSKLIEEGKVQKLTVIGDPDRYDANIHTHCHFYCQKCKKVYDLDIKSDIINLIQKQVEHKVLDSSIVFYGICKDCLGGNNG